MADAAVKCPKCGTSIPITEALAGPLLEATKKQYQADIAAMEEEQKRALGELETTVAARAKAAAQAQVAADFEREQSIATQAQQEAETLRAKLTVAQQAQAEALRKERELADRERELNLTIQTQVNDQISEVKLRAISEANDANRLKLLEKDTLLESMQNKVAELQQKLTQGSQQTQGEVQELDLEQKLRSAFPFDTIGEVAKGVSGADVNHVVVSATGAQCGTILYESKRTKNWSPAWLPKLREDGRKAQADILVLVSTALPEEVTTFGNIDNVWVCSPITALPLAAVLRMSLLSVHATKQAQDGMRTKAEEIYSYVTGSQFRRRVEALVEAFTTMQEDLTAEQKAVQRQWAKRAAQIERVLTSTSGMFGDMQGIAGKALSEPEGLALSSGGGE